MRFGIVFVWRAPDSGWFVFFEDGAVGFRPLTFDQLFVLTGWPVSWVVSAIGGRWDRGAA